MTVAQLQGPRKPRTPPVGSRYRAPSWANQREWDKAMDEVDEVVPEKPAAEPQLPPVRIVKGGGW